MILSRHNLKYGFRRNKKSNFNYEDIFYQLEQLGCRAILLKFYELLEYNTIIEILNKLKFSRIESVEIFIKYDECYNYNALPFESLYSCNNYFYSIPGKIY